MTAASAAQQVLEPDRTQIEAFVQSLFRHAAPNDFASLRVFDHKNKPLFTSMWPVKMAGGIEYICEVATDLARRAANNPSPAVFCPPIAIFRNGESAKETDIAQGLVLSVELDEHPNDGRQKLEGVLGPATMVIASGGAWNGEDKLHLHWRLTKPAAGVADLAKLKRARKLATQLIGSDPSAVPVVHPLRWPGSWHTKGKPRLCSIIENNSDIEINLYTALTALEASFDFSPGANGDSQEQTPDSSAWHDLVRDIQAGSKLHDSTLKLAAKLIKAGLCDGAAVNLLRGLMESATGPRDERWQARYDDIPRTVSTAGEKFGSQEASWPTFDPWDKFTVPAFPLHILPPVVAEFVKAESVVAGCDYSTMAMSALCAISAALDHRFALKMMRNGNWWVSPRLWVLLVGDPSRKKTPAIKAAIREIVAQEIALRDEHEAAKQLHLAKDGDPKDGPPPPLRFIVRDTTIEMLGTILARQNRGILVIHDEFSGFIAAMERYSKGSASDRPFWLTAFDGGPYSVDRVGRGEKFIQNLSVSLIGGIQPEKLAEMRGLTSDGLLQRFLPVMMGPSAFPVDTDTWAQSANYHLLVRKLLWLDPRKLHMSADALAEMESLRHHIHELEMASGGLAAGFQAFIGKLAGYVGSLALIMHMIGDECDENRVSAATAAKVNCLIREFILPHAFEFYRTNEQATGGDRLQRLASWILTSGKDRFVPSDFASNVSDLKGLGLWDLNQRLSPLVAGGWLLTDDKGPVAKSWRLASGIAERFKVRAETEEQRKARLAELMKSPRKNQP
jgi:hypothetical protein